MTAARRAWSADMLHFWFHELDSRDWFSSGPEVDREMARRFGRWWAALRHLGASTFLENPLTARAAILLFDQVPRNIHRGTALAFASDPLARTLAKAAIQRHWDRGLSVPQQQFLAMPLMHSERRADQLESVAYFAKLGDPAVLRFARAHRQMVARFGRFPHRNAVLDRISSDREREALAAGFAW